jgi:ISXO2-like transposase domain
VQIDDAYLGGEKPGKVGRGAANKVPFVIAVATRKNKPVYTQLRCVPGLTKEAIKAYAEANIAPGARVVSDGLGCFGGLADAELKHKAIVTGSGRPKDERLNLKWTNTGLGNIKSAITGTCRSFDPQHTERYLASYEWRFNRRFDLEKNVERLARIAAQTAPAPYQRAEISG